MPIPVPFIPWIISPNNLTVASGTVAADYRAALYAVKRLLLTPGGMSVDHSCDGASAGAPGDGVDRWTSDASLVWGTGAAPRSWIVLRAPGIGANFQLLVSCRYGATAPPNERWIDVAVSPSAGFSGGAVDTTPAAADQIVIRDGSASGADVNGYWIGDAAASFTSAAHAWGTSDGSQVRIVVCTSTASKPLMILMIGRTINAPAGHTSPAFHACWWSAADATTSKLRYADLLAAARVWGAHAGTSYAMHLGAYEGYAGSSVGAGLTTPNVFTGTWPLTTCVLAAAARGRPRGVMGCPPDLWWGSSGLTVEGVTMDAAGDTRRLVKWGDLVLPWDGVTAPHDGAAVVTAAATVGPTLPVAPEGTRYVPLIDDL